MSISPNRKDAESIHLYTDASGSLGFGAYFHRAGMTGSYITQMVARAICHSGCSPHVGSPLGCSPHVGSPLGCIDTCTHLLVFAQLLSGVTFWLNSPWHVGSSSGYWKASLWSQLLPHHMVPGPGLAAALTCQGSSPCSRSMQPSRGNS